LNEGIKELDLLLEFLESKKESMYE